ncbi:hypothetical protein PYH37_004975 [Sinorhizobium numidicum]|uniref:Uncharacterized protein n=1 Tax=Sinorhizobium numidicum TaxID=680248 RepID=A0ABY8CXD0_9HYPH|nr:hypothetical protein [Sinorhizobium numidicum]WEX76655.1 hypothetical protein PYH37_004975 [Sinorhizobium numidicum]WEX83316.1 hypothetical protein PYH38_005687 [Sinorhizobium numidicum]
MKSNSFGSFIQTIVISVPNENAEQVASILGIEPFEIIDNQARFEWTRQTTRKGDDEDVVFDLSRELGFDFEWRIDWDKSDY